LPFPKGMVSININESGYFSDMAAHMTKREAYAIAALQGLLASEQPLPDDAPEDPDGIQMYLAEVAVQYADALIQALKQ